MLPRLANLVGAIPIGENLRTPAPNRKKGISAFAIDKKVIMINGKLNRMLEKPHKKRREKRRKKVAVEVVAVAEV